MPYDVDNPPDKLRGHDKKTQRQWVHVFNSCYDKHGDDTRCSKVAWGVTGGWKGKGLDPDNPDFEFTPNDPDRDLFLELDIQEKLADFELEEKVSKELGHLIEFQNDSE